jgi:hypothetical protein
MGLCRLKQAVEVLWVERRGGREEGAIGSDRNAYLRDTVGGSGDPPTCQHVWHIVPIRAKNLNRGHSSRRGCVDAEGSLCLEEDVIDWDEINAFANGGVPLTSLPTWPAGPELSSTCEVVIPQQKEALFCSLGSHVKEHGVVLSMHNGKLHVAEGMEAGMSPLSPFPSSNDSVKDAGSWRSQLYQDYFRE